MKKLLLSFVTILLLSSCDLLLPEKWIGWNEPERFKFTLGNPGKNTYEDIVIYAIDSNGVFVDSSANGGIIPNDVYWVTIDLEKLRCVSQGFFKVKASLNGKTLNQEFGKIDKPDKPQEFYIEFRDSTIVVK